MSQLQHARSFRDLIVYQKSKVTAKRRYERHFVSKLTDADGEQLEIQHWIDIAADCGYLTQEDVSIIKSELAEIGRMLNSMIEKASAFCGDTSLSVRESAVDYFSTDD